MGAQGVRNVWPDRSAKRSKPRAGERAGEQNAAVSLAQLLDAGFSRSTVSDRVRDGALYPLYRGTYCVGHEAIGHDTWIQAGTLATGGTACDISAAHLWDLRTLEERDPVHVTCAKKRRGRKAKPKANGLPYQPELITHIAQLTADDWTTRRGIRVTSVERTILDCCASCPYKEARRIVGQALVSRRTSIVRLVQILDRTPGHHGQKTLRHILLTAELTRSDAEDLLNEILKSNGLTGYRANVRVPGVGELDFFDQQSMTALEYDSREFHDNPLQRADDRAKRTRARARGIQVRTVRWRHLTSERERFVRSLRSS